MHLFFIIDWNLQLYFRSSPTGASQSSITRGAKIKQKTRLTISKEMTHASQTAAFTTLCSKLALASDVTTSMSNLENKN